MRKIVLENAQLLEMAGNILHTAHFPFLLVLHRKSLEVKDCRACVRMKTMTKEFEDAKQAVLALDSRRIGIMKQLLSVDKLVVVTKRQGRVER
jgi:hypothetical protein